MNYFPIQLFKILCAGWRRRYVIAIPVLLMPILGAIVALTQTKLYNSHTSMLIQETAKMNPFLEDLAVSAMLKERVEGLTTLLHSRHILGNVASDLKLIDNDSDDAQRDQVIADLSARLNMQIIGKDLIRIEVKSHQKALMAQTLESVSRHFIEQLLAPERSSIVDSSRFLEEHLRTRQIELNTAEASLAEFKSQHASALPELHSMNIDRLNKLRQHLSEKESALAASQRSVGSFNQLLSATNPVVGRIEESIVTIRSQLALARSRYTDKHSQVQALIRNLERLESERQSVIKSTEDAVDTNKLWDMAVNITPSKDDPHQALLISQLRNLQNAKNQVGMLIEEVKYTKATIDDIESKLKEFSLHGDEMYKLQSDLRVKRELYENLLERNEMADVMGSLGQFEQGKRIKIIDRPFTPSAPSNLPAALYIIIGIMAGLALGIGLATVLELTNSTIRYRQQLEDLCDLTVIGRIPPIAPIA